MPKKKYKKKDAIQHTVQPRSASANKYIKDFQNTILKFQNNIWTPLDYQTTPYTYSSWSNFSQYQHDQSTSIVKPNIDNLKKNTETYIKTETEIKTKTKPTVVTEKKSFKSMTVILRPDKYQKALFNTWMQAFKIIYRATINYIRRIRSDTQLLFHNVYIIRRVLYPYIHYICDQTYKHNNIYIWKKKLILKKHNYRQNKQCNLEIYKLQRQFKKYTFGTYKMSESYNQELQIFINNEYNKIQENNTDIRNKMDKIINVYENLRSIANEEFKLKIKQIDDKYKLDIENLKINYDKILKSLSGNVCKQKLSSERDKCVDTIDKINQTYATNSFQITEKFKNIITSLNFKEEKKLAELKAKWCKNNNPINLKIAIINFNSVNYDVIDYTNYVNHLRTYKKDLDYQEWKREILNKYGTSKSDECKFELEKLKKQCIRQKNENTQHHNHNNLCVSYEKSTISARQIRESVAMACSNVKACHKNKINGGIKDFSLKGMGLKKDTNIFKIEACYFNQGSFLFDKVGKIKAFKDSLKFNLSEIGLKKTYDSCCTLKYDRLRRKYMLLVPIKVNPEDYITKIHKLEPKNTLVTENLSPEQIEEIKIRKRGKRKAREVKLKENRKLRVSDKRRYITKMQKGRNKRIDGVSQRTIKKQHRKEIKRQEKLERGEEELKVKNEYISLDPGLRTFCTGISENRVIEIGDNLIKKTLPYVNKLMTLDKESADHAKVTKDLVMSVNERKTDIKKRKSRSKIRNFLEMKLENIMDDLHWKSINYLTTNYNNLLIGNMGLQGIVAKTTSKLRPKYKLIAHRMCIGKYRSRLEWRCKLNNVKYKMVDERYTSKMCSRCGFLKEDLGSKKIFDCNSCQVILDRDVNGARNIYLKTFMLGS